MLKKVLLVLALIGTFQPVWALSIQRINSITEAHEEMLKADQKTLVVFDVDETLLCYYTVGLFIVYDLEAIPAEDKQYSLTMKDKHASYINKVGREQANALFNSFYLTKSSGQLVEPDLSKTIYNLQARGVKAIALTALPGGQFGSVDCGRTLRYDILKSHGIDFRSSFNSEFLVFDNLNAYNKEYPMYYKGILFANYRNNKGVVLSAFFDRIGWTPKKVLFFDDNIERVREVCKEMKNRSIPCQGYWYRGVDHCNKPPFNRAIAEVQLEYLIKHDTLLTAIEAKSVLVSGL